MEYTERLNSIGETLSIEIHDRQEHHGEWLTMKKHAPAFLVMTSSPPQVRQRLCNLLPHPALPGIAKEYAKVALRRLLYKQRLVWREVRNCKNREPLREEEGRRQRSASSSFEHTKCYIVQTVS